jgi:hypothetical protein
MCIRSQREISILASLGSQLAQFRLELLRERGIVQIALHTLWRSTRLLHDVRELVCE